MYQYVHSSLIYNRQKMERSRCPSTAEWILKLWYIYTAIKNDEFVKFLGTWI